MVCPVQVSESRGCISSGHWPHHSCQVSRGQAWEVEGVSPGAVATLNVAILIFVLNLCPSPPPTNVLLHQNTGERPRPGVRLGLPLLFQWGLHCGCEKQMKEGILCGFPWGPGASWLLSKGTQDSAQPSSLRVCLPELKAFRKSCEPAGSCFSFQAREGSCA